MQLSSIRTVIPKPVRTPLGQVLRSCEAPFYYRRAIRILRDYTEHYEKARAVFKSDGSSPTLSSFSIAVASPDSNNNFIEFADDYSVALEIVASSAQRLLSQAKECTFFPQIPDRDMRDRTDDIPAVRAGEVIAIQLKNPLAIEGLEELCAPLVQSVEQRLFGCYVMVDKVYVYRSPTCRQTPQGSWMWHYDNHPNEVIKLMIYLNDVEEDGAPFQYLRATKTKAPVLGEVAPLFGDSRVSPTTINECLANGFESHKVTGQRGTVIVFDNNIIHRGSMASKGHRDVLILQLRPSTSSLRPFIDRRWTGSFQHAPFNRNPNNIEPTTKRLRHFS